MVLLRHLVPLSGLILWLAAAVQAENHKAPTIVLSAETIKAAGEKFAKTVKESAIAAVKKFVEANKSTAKILNDLPYLDEKFLAYLETSISKSDQMKPNSDNTKSNSGNIIPDSDNIVPKSGNIEPKSGDIEPKSDDIEFIPDNIETKSVNIEPNPDKIELLDTILSNWKGSVTKDNGKLFSWQMSADSAFQATMDVIHKSKFTIKTPIVILVGVGATGGIGLSVAKLLANTGYSVTIVVLPRYKTELLKAEEADDLWEQHLERVKATPKITTRDFRQSTQLDASIAAYGKYLRGYYNAILDIPKVNFANVASTINGAAATDESKQFQKSLEIDGKAEAAKLNTFLNNLEVAGGMVIESYVGAGYEHPVEVVQKYAVRYQLAGTVAQLLDGLQSRGVVVGSFDLPCNTTTESGYFHVSKQDGKTVTMIQNVGDGSASSYIPHFLVLITVPRESLMALEWTLQALRGPTSTTPWQYQFQITQYIYLTVFKDKYFQDVSMSACIREVTPTPTDPNDAMVLAAFLKGLEAAEKDFGTTKGFLELTLPQTVIESLQYTFTIQLNNLVPTKIPGVSENKKIPVSIATFQDYANMFKGNRLLPCQSHKN